MKNAMTAVGRSIETRFIPLPLRGLALICGPRGRSHLIPENKGALDARAHDIRPAVAVQVGGDELRTDSRAVVDQLGNKLRAAFRLRIAHRAVPVKYRGAVRVGVEMAFQMGIEPLADDEVCDAIAVEIREGRSVRFAESDIPGVLRGQVTHDVVPHEGNVPLRVALLLKPGKTPAVRGNRRHDIVPPVAIHIVDTHLRPAVAELRG